jgi:hypothetical protein
VCFGDVDPKFVSSRIPLRPSGCGIEYAITYIDVTGSMRDLVVFIHSPGYPMVS